MIPLEIERKYLVSSDAWRLHADDGILLRQGYMQAARGIVRVRTAGEQAFLTIKGPREGIRRSEFEYPIPMEHAVHLLEAFCEYRLVEKTRFKVPHGWHTWEVDVFSGCNEGLVTAEVELRAEDEVVDIPLWVGEDVSRDPRYANSNLARRPWSDWDTR